MPPHQGSGGGFFGNRKNLIPISIAAVVVVIAVIIIIVVSSGSNNDSSAERSHPPSPSTSASGSTSTSASPSASGSTTPPATTPGWAAYSQFSELVGTHDSDTAGAWKGATCTFEAPDTTIPGMADQIQCKNLTGTKLEINIARFDTAADVTAYGTTLVDTDKYTQKYWTLMSLRRGMLYQAPATADFADVTTSVCSIPTFLVQLYGPAGSGLTTQTVFDEFWMSAPFPNDTPDVCAS